ncbi:helix-turn-helix domain-containing protein, partial [Clostridium perfringens]
MNSVGDTIFFMRKKAGITLEKLAESIHVSRQALQNWEKGRRDCSITMLSLICDNLGFKNSLQKY